MKYIFKILKALTKINFQLKSEKCKFYIIKMNFFKFVIILKGIYIFKLKI